VNRQRIEHDYLQLTSTYPNFVFSITKNHNNKNTLIDVLRLDGTFPITHEGHTFNVPVRIDIPPSYPNHPPMCSIQPTQEMRLVPSQILYPDGSIHTSDLSHWKSSYTLAWLLDHFSKVFSVSPPVFATRSHQQQNLATFNRPQQVSSFNRPQQVSTFNQPQQLTFNQPQQLPTFNQPQQLPTFNQPQQLPTFNQPQQLPTFNQPQQLPTFNQQPRLVPQSQLSTFGQHPFTPMSQQQGPNHSLPPSYQQITGQQNSPPPYSVVVHDQQQPVPYSQAINKSVNAYQKQPINGQNSMAPPSYQQITNQSQPSSFSLPPYLPKQSSPFINTPQARDQIVSNQSSKPILQKQPSSDSKNDFIEALLSRIKNEKSSIQDKIDRETERKTQLIGLENKIKNSMRELNQLRQQFQSSIHELEENNSKIVEKAQEIETNLLIPTSLVNPSDTLSKQILEQITMNCAIDDTLYYLEKAFEKRIFSAEIFLREVRKLARSQFVARAYIQKIQTVQLSLRK